MVDRSLLCPSCAAVHDAQERFCSKCGMPLVARVGEARVSGRQAWARKIDPRYANGGLVHVAAARNQVEAEFIAGLLLEEGVPSLIRRAGGFDVPDFMAAGPREILVPASGVEAAHDALLLDTSTAARPTPQSASVAMRLIASLLLALALGAVVLFMGTHVWD
jgi:hypothetical protein